MFARFNAIFSPTEADTVLDVGVTSDTLQLESNYFEQAYPFPHRITCVGTEDGAHLIERFPGLSYQRVRSGQPLPFKTGQFDIVFSNAVLEHVGNRQMQAAFLDELQRVCRRGFFVTTPNRWFPIEHHTGLPLLHYLPIRVFRRILKQSGYGYWADEQNLNPLSVSDLQRILPANASIEKIMLFGATSNLIGYLRRSAS